MKNLDIEQLERKNIYNTPANFFETMQAKVMREVGQEEKINILAAAPSVPRPKMNLWYAAAAAIALIFGAAYMLNSNTEKTETFAQNTESYRTDARGEVEIKNEISDNAVQPATQNYVTLVNDLTLAEIGNQKETKPVTAAAKNQMKKSFAGVQKAEAQMEMILEDFSAEDLAALSQNTAQDVYLDLYY